MADRSSPPPSVWQSAPGPGAASPTARLRAWLLSLVTPAGYALAGFIALVIGVALVHLPGKLVFGAVIAGASVVMILVRPYWGLLLYAATVFLRPGEIWPVLAGLKLERIVGVLTLASLAMESWRRHGGLTIDSSRLSKWLGAFWLASFASVVTSYWPTHSVGESIEVLKLIAFYVMVIQLVDSRRRLAVFVWTYLAFIGYFGYAAVSDYFHGRLKYAQGIERAIGENSTSGDPNQLGATMACTVPLLLLLIGRAREPWKRALYVALLVLSVLTLSLTGSRSGILGLIAGLIFVWWRSRRRVLYGGLITLALVLGFLALPGQYRERYTSMGQEEIDASSQGRLDAWRVGMEMMMDRPLLGVGLGCFGVAHSEGYDEGNWLEAHSLYVQVPAEIGIPGAVAFFGFLVVALWTFSRSRKLAHRLWPTGIEEPLLVGMTGAFVVLAVTGIFGHSMMRPTWFLFAALGQAVYRLARTEDARGR